MKKNKLFTALIVVLVLCVAMCCLVACGGKDNPNNDPNNPTPPAHTHTYATEWSYDTTYHWHSATCEHTAEVKDKEEHTFVDGVCKCGVTNVGTEGLEFVLDEETNTFKVSYGEQATATEVVVPMVHTQDGVTAFVTIIDDFYGCDITSIHIPNTITTIAYYALGNTGITSINIPNSVTLIDSCAFAECKNLESITFEKESQLKIIDELTFYKTALTSIEIPASVEEIDKQAFYEVSQLETVTFEKGSKLAKIGEYSFSDTGLTAIVLPENLIEIAECAFWWCWDLKKVTLPNSLTIIGKKAFKETGIGNSTIIIGANVTSIGSGAFDQIFNGKQPKEGTISCVAATKPDGWADDWCPITQTNKVTVEWGYKPNQE